MFKRLSLRIKLSLAFMLVAAIVGTVGIYEVRSVQHLNSLFLDLIDQDFKRLDLLDEIKVTSSSIENNVLAYDQAIESGTQKTTAIEEKAALAALKKDMDDFLSEYHQILQEDPGHQAPLQSIDTLTADAERLTQAANAFVDGIAGSKPQELATRQVALEDASTKFEKNIDELIVIEDEQIAQEDAQVDVSVTRLIRSILLLVVGTAAIALVVGLLVAESIARSMRKLRDGAIRLANGDFSKSVDVLSGGEIGQLANAFNNMSTRLRDSYQRLEVETERDKTLLESLGEGVIAVDAQANITLINKQALEMLEIPAEENAVGKPATQAFAIYGQQDQLLTPEQTPVTVALQSLKAVDEVVGFHKKAGAKILVNISANPVIVKGAVVGAIMTVRDVTKEKEVDRMKTEFISLASHQLRTPLSAIRWFTEMLISGDAGQLLPEQLDFAKNISDSTDRMIALVNALLNISRIESGRIMVDPKPTDLRELVSGIINDLKAKTEEKKQSLVISVHQDLPKISLDPRLIGQVYLNLLTNAVKYTPKGGEISVFISKKDDQVISQVTDSGYGIPKDQQSRVFQKFFRASNAVKVETDGTGLGLYLIKSVIESSGGKIWFESEEGKGTTFWFSIPLSGMKAKQGEVTLDV
jgi:PAS domain S-box-containing protein